MILKILRQYEEDGYSITELTRDGETVDSVIKTPIFEGGDTEEPEVEVPTDSPEDVQLQILLNTEYITILTELNMGM